LSKKNFKKSVFCPNGQTGQLLTVSQFFNIGSCHEINILRQIKTMILVQITSPVLPGKKTKAKLEKLIKAVVLEVAKDDVCNIYFYNDGKDFYGQVNFQILVMDSGKNELDDLRNEIYTQLLTMLIGK
jgi:hypothetical protein